MLTQLDLDRAAAEVYRHMAPTPQYRWPLLETELGATTWVKHENHTPIGAFKVRGGLVWMAERVRSGRAGPLITATRGNHGQSIPWAARIHGQTVQVLVPEGNSREKNALMAALGAEVVTHGADFDSARQEAERRAAAGYGELIPSFDPLLVHGVATWALELLQAAPDLERLYVPIGMGSGICGAIGVRDLLGCRTEIIGVVADGAPAYAMSLAAGRPVSSNAAVTMADGLAVRVPHPDALAVIRKGVKRIVRVTDGQIEAAMRQLFRCTHNVAEGAGAASLAAAAQVTEDNGGRSIGVVVTGGNIDADRFAAVLAGAA